MTETITAPPEQVFNGHPVGVGGKAYCAACKRTLRDGDRVGAYAYKAQGGRTWGIPQLRCTDCRRSSLPQPTLGTTELLLHARLAVTSDQQTEQAHLALTEVSQAAHSPPNKGGQP